MTSLEATAGRYRGPGGLACVLSEEEHEVTLHAERPVVAREAVPVERVRLAKGQVADEETVSGEVRKEQIETDTDGDTGTLRKPLLARHGRPAPRRGRPSCARGLIWPRACPA